LARERSAWTTTLALAACALAAAALLLPFFVHQLTTHARAPLEGDGDPGSQRIRSEYYAFGTQGATEPATAQEPLLHIGALTLLGVVGTFLCLALELLFGLTERLRRVQLALTGAAALGLAGALAIGWFILPTAAGASGPFTRATTDAGIVWTTPGWAWPAAGLAFLLALAYGLSKYAQGRTELDDLVRRKAHREGRGA
jgi:hypothetical protein